MSNLHVKTQILWFFRTPKIFEDTKTHRILLIHEIRLRMRIFVLNIKSCFIPLNEHFLCTIVNFETLKPHTPIYTNGGRSLPDNVEIYDSGSSATFFKNNITKSNFK